MASQRAAGRSTSGWMSFAKLLAAVLLCRAEGDGIHGSHACSVGKWSTWQFDKCPQQSKHRTRSVIWDKLTHANFLASELSKQKFARTYCPERRQRTSACQPCPCVLSKWQTSSHSSNVNGKQCGSIERTKFRVVIQRAAGFGCARSDLRCASRYAAPKAASDLVTTKSGRGTIQELLVRKDHRCNQCKCLVSSWSPWSVCSPATCSRGRNRSVITAATCGATKCPHLKEVVVCKPKRATAVWESCSTTTGSPPTPSKSSNTATGVGTDQLSHSAIHSLRRKHSVKPVEQRKKQKGTNKLHVSKSNRRLGQCKGCVGRHGECEAEGFDFMCAPMTKQKQLVSTSTGWSKQVVLACPKGFRRCTGSRAFCPQEIGACSRCGCSHTKQKAVTGSWVGLTCNYWGAPNKADSTKSAAFPAWCYVDPTCPTALPVSPKRFVSGVTNTIKHWWASCSKKGATNVPTKLRRQSAPMAHALVRKRESSSWRYRFMQPGCECSNLADVRGVGDTCGFWPLPSKTKVAPIDGSKGAGAWRRKLLGSSNSLQRDDVELPWCYGYIRPKYRDSAKENNILWWDYCDISRASNQGSAGDQVAAKDHMSPVLSKRHSIYGALDAIHKPGGKNTAELNKCKCLGALQGPAADMLSNFGRTCRLWKHARRTRPWCYVDRRCPYSKAGDMPGVSWANCGLY